MSPVTTPVDAPSPKADAKSAPKIANGSGEVKAKDEGKKEKKRKAEAVEEAKVSCRALYYARPCVC